MSVYLSLFLTFFEIGAVSFGGGYGMISLVKEEVFAHGWLAAESDFLNLIAVSESTPGPLAVNMATFIGSAQGGVAGALCATLGVVLPSFIIILIIAAALKNFLKLAGVQAFLGGVKPTVAGLIAATGITMTASGITGFEKLGDGVSFDYKALIIFAVTALIAIVYKKALKKTFSPILLILISAGLGILLYAF